MEPGNYEHSYHCEVQVQCHGDEIRSQYECEDSVAENNNFSDKNEIDYSSVRNEGQQNIIVAQRADSQEEDVNDENFFDTMNDTFVHPNLNCKTADAVIMILEYFLRNRLTWVALEGMLKLFHSILGDESQLPKTKYLFKKVFGDNDQAIFHFYCKNCGLYLDTLDNLKKQCVENESGESNISCTNCQHKFTLNRMNEGHFFIEIPVRHQILNKIVKNPEILNYNTDASPDNSIRDIFDGRLYQSLKQKIGGGKLITLTINTDGVRIFKSKKRQACGLYKCL